MWNFGVLNRIAEYVWDETVSGGQMSSIFVYPATPLPLPKLAK